MVCSLRRERIVIAGRENLLSNAELGNEERVEEDLNKTYNGD